MTNRSRYFSTSLIVLLSIGVFAVTGYSQHVKSDNEAAITEGANKMMEGNKIIMDLMSKKGMKDAELTSAEKMMTDGYNMIVKGESMMTGNTMAEGKEMVKRGATMMMEAKKAVTATVEKKGMTQECSDALSQCELGEKQIEYGLQRNLPGGQQ